MLDKRFTEPLYTATKAASYLGIKPATLGYWVRKDGLMTVEAPETPQSPRLPFIALVEAQLYMTFREHGLSLQAIAAGMIRVRKELGVEFLREGRLATDGRDILMDYARAGKDPEWTRAKDLQVGIPEVIKEGLRLIKWAEDGYPQSVRLSAYGLADIVADPRFAYGQPIIEGTRTRVEDILCLFKAGETLKAIAQELQVDSIVVEQLIRPHVDIAA